MKLFGLKNCDTCKKALKALREAGQSPDFHDVRLDGVTRAYLSKWAKTAGWQKLVNKSSTTWRGLSDGEKAACDNEEAAIELMLENPTLIKRPIIETDDGVTIGWAKDVQNHHGV